MEVIEVYGYVRVSTDEQEKTGFSIDSQVTDIEEEAERRGFILNDIFVDDGYSATYLKRPSIQKLIRILAKSKKPKVIITRHPDRLVRNLTYKRSLQCVFKKFNVHIICLQGSWEGKDSDADVVADISMLFAENEVRKIPRRVIDGYRGSADLGNYPIGGVPPRGYRREKNKNGKGSYLIPCEKEAKEVVKIFETLATNLYTIRRMTKHLQKNKVMGKRWDEKIVRNIVDNPIYYGRLTTEWYDKENHTIPLISKELWTKVQNIVHHRKAMTHHHYYFKRLVRCQTCGSYLTCEPAWKTKRNGKDKILYKYYTCQTCKKRINEQNILKSFLQTYNRYKYKILDKKIIEETEEKIKKIKQRIEYLNKDYDDGMIEEEFYRSSIQVAYQKIHSLQQEIETIHTSNIQDFYSLSQMQQRAFIVANVKEIHVDLKEKKIDIQYLQEE